MEYFKRVKKVFLSMLFSAVLMLPLLIKFSHVFECDSHKNISANNKETDVHQDEIGCEVCDFSFISSNYYSEEYPDFYNPNVPSKKERYSSFVFLKEFKITNTQLRAPPCFIA